MSEEELNSYRLTSMEEPSDEMLSAIMKEAAEEAKAKKEKALREFLTISARLVMDGLYVARFLRLLQQEIKNT